MAVNVRMVRVDEGDSSPELSTWTSSTTTRDQRLLCGKKNFVLQRISIITIKRAIYSVELTKFSYCHIETDGGENLGWRNDLNYSGDKPTLVLRERS